MLNLMNVSSLLWGKGTPCVKRIIYSLLSACILFGFYSIVLLLFGTGKLEVELDTPEHDMVLQIYGYGGKSRELASITKQISRGKSAHTFSFYSGIKVIRLDLGFIDNVQLNITKLKFTQDFLCYEIPFSGNTAADIITKERFHQLKYLGNGKFLTIGDDPYFYFRLKDTPRKNTILFHLIFLIPFFALLVFFFPQWVFLLKVLYNKIHPAVVKIKTSANRLFHDYPFLIYVFMVILLGWGFEIFNFTLNLDDGIIYTYSLQTIQREWLAEDRWGMAVVSFFTGNPTVPVIPLVITLFCYLLSFCILFYKPNHTDKYYIFPIYAVFPMLFQSFSFSSLNPAIGIIFLLSALSFSLLNKKSKIYFLLAVIFSTFAIGSYAAFAVFIAIVGLSSWLHRGIRHDFYCSFKYIRYIACKYIFLAASCLLLHKMIMAGCNNIYGIKSHNFLLQNYIRPITNFSLWFQLFFQKIQQCYSGNTFPNRIIFQSLAVGGCLLVIGFFLICQKKNFLHKCILVCGMLFLLIAPFSSNIVSQYAVTPFRVITLLLPVVLASIFQLALIFSRPYPWLRSIIIGLLVFISVQYLWNLNQCSYLSYLQNKRDILVISKLQNRINAIPEFALKSAVENNIPTIIIGRNLADQLICRPPSRQYPNWNAESVGISCLDDAPRIIAMMNMFCYPHYIVSSASADQLSFIESMPMWPLNGSIAFYKDSLIIKLSDHLPDDSKALNRKLRNRSPFPINGAEELVATQPDPMRLLHTYQAAELEDPKVTAKGSNILIKKVNKKDRLISFPARKFDVPYVILEITADFDDAGLFTLWDNQGKQFMQFAFTAGINHLRLRCPSYFLNKKFQISFGDDKVSRVLLKEIKVYEDAKYTENLLRLNPDLNRQKLMEIRHE